MAYEDFLGKKVMVMTGYFSSTIGILEEPKHEFLLPGVTYRERNLYRVPIAPNGGGVVVSLEDVKFLNDQS